MENTTKICTQCKRELNLIYFKKKYKNKNGSLIFSSKCKECSKFLYYNKEEVREYNKIYYSKNKEEVRKTQRAWEIRNKERRNDYFKSRMESNPLLKMADRLRRRTNFAIRRTILSNKTSHSFDIIGLSPEETKRYIESKFKEGMTWENYGKYGWHIDHIIPLISAKTEEEVYRLCHFTNLQPLWAKENLSKNDKLPETLESLP